MCCVDWENGLLILGMHR